MRRTRRGFSSAKRFAIETHRIPPPHLGTIPGQKEDSAARLASPGFNDQKDLLGFRRIRAEDRQISFIELGLSVFAAAIEPEDRDSLPECGRPSAHCGFPHVVVATQSV